MSFLKLSRLTTSPIFFKLPCCSNPCKNGGTFYPGNETCKFKCVCAPGFVGEECEKGKPTFFSRALMESFIWHVAFRSYDL